MPNSVITSYNASSKRVKVTLACSLCRKKKVKCDGVQPTCHRCNTMGLACQYSDPPKKRGPPKTQVEFISNRAHRIESLVHHTAPALSTSALVPDSSVKSQPLDHEVIDANLEAFVPLIKNTMLGLVANMTSTIFPGQGTPGSHNIKNDFFPQNHPPTKSYLLAYFDHVNVFLPVLSKPHFMQQWHRQLVDPLLCHAVAALGARCCPTSGPDANPSKPFFDHCLFLLEQPGPRDHASSLSTVQALLLLCWYTHLCGQMQTCAHLRQKLLQANDQLGLHRDPDSSAGLVCMEMHRRAYWITFVTDRWLCWCLDQCGLPAQPLIQTNSPLPWPRLEDQQLYLIDKKSATNDPSDLDDLTTTTAEHALQITTFAELIKLASIMDDIARFTRPSLCSDPHRRPGPVPLQVYQRQLAPLATKLTTWLLQLPYYLEFCRPVEDQPPAPMASLYHLMYYTVQIMLNQPLAMFPTPPNAPEPSPTLARTICTNACNTILHLAEQMLLHHQLPFLGNVAILSLNLAASLYLYEPLGLPLTSLMPHQHLHTIFKTITLLKQCLPDPVPAGLSDLHHAVDGFLFHHYQIRLLQDTDRPDPLPSDPWSSPDDVKPRKKRRYSQSSGSPLSTPDLSSRSPMSSVTMTVTPTASLPSCDHSPLLISPQLDGDLLDVGLDTLLHEVSPLASPSSTCPSPCSPKDWTAAWIEEHAELWAFMNVQPPLPHDQSHLASAHLNPPCPSATMTQSALVSHPMLPLHPPLDHFLVHGLSHPPMTKCTNWICPNNDDLIDPYTYTFMLDNSLVIP